MAKSSNLDATRALYAEQQQAARKTSTANAPGRGNDEIQSMLAEVDLLSVIRSDTGLQGRRSGERIDFKRCPVCGHENCFSFYESTNSWACFGASNATGYDGGSALEYYKATRQDDDVAAVTWLREATNHPYEPKPKESTDATAEPAQDADSDGFPPITPCKVTNPPKRAPVLIEGVLRQGHTMLVTSRSKAGKTFLMLELAVAVASGTRWLGRRCEQGRVLFVNPEVDAPSAENRLHDVAEALGVDLQIVKPNVDFWHLRGHAQGIEDTAGALFRRVSRGTYVLIILDSVYELYTGDETKAEDARKFFHGIDKIYRQLGCAIAMTHHHAKGNRSDLDALDRGSGSGVFGRKPDAILDLIQVFPPSDSSTTFEDGVTVWRVSDSGLREFPSLVPFDVYFRYPRHYVVADDSTASWKPKSSQQTGGRITGEKNKGKAASRADKCIIALASEFFARGISSEGIGGTEAAEIVSEAIGEPLKPETLKGYVDGSELFMVDPVSPRRWRAVPRRKPEEPPPSLGV